MPSSDVWLGRQLFGESGLFFPTIPQELAPRFNKRGDWCFSTKRLTVSPYAFDEYVRQGRKKRVRDYVVLAHAGYGANSYALHYYLVKAPLRLFLQVGWGGAYMNARQATRDVNRCFKLADRLVLAVDRARRVHALSSSGFLMVAASEFYGSSWHKPGEVPTEGERGAPITKSPHLVLSEALRWVNGLR